MHHPTDKELEATVAEMLKIGVSLAALFVLVGGVLLLKNTHAGLPDYAHFHAVDASLRSLSSISSGAFHRQPSSVIQFGLLVLIATPIARVVFCLVGFLRQQNRLYAGISSIVLAVLIYSLTKGAH